MHPPNPLHRASVARAKPPQPTAFRAHSLLTLALCLLLGTTASTRALAADLASLWPHDDGRQWTYTGSFTDRGETVGFDGSLFFAGTQTVGGQVVQILDDTFTTQPVATTPVDGAGPLFRMLWRYRPQLRPQLEARASLARESFSFWPFLFLGPAKENVGMLFTSTRTGAWRDEISDWSWWYLTDELTPGSTFTLQLIPDLASDVFLHGEVRSVDVPVTVNGVEWSACTIMDYSVAQGPATLTDDLGTPIGTMEVDLVGTTVFASGVGPISTWQRTTVVALDCPTCPFTVGDVLDEGTLELVESSVAIEATSWSAIKASW